MSSILWLFGVQNSFLMVFFFQSEASDTAKIANLLPKIWSILRNYINTSSIEFFGCFNISFQLRSWTLQNIET